MALRCERGNEPWANRDALDGHGWDAEKDPSEKAHSESGGDVIAPIQRQTREQYEQGGREENLDEQSS